MNTEKLSDLLSQQSWDLGSVGDCLTITNDVGITIYLVNSEDQILVETPLFPLSSVKDLTELNNMVLRSHHLVPLSTVCIKPSGGEDCYVAFGSLSSDSKDSVIIEEIETLFENVGEFLELYSVHLNDVKAVA